MQPERHVFSVDSFRFRSGETAHDLKIGYQTLGNPADDPVLVLHGTGGSGSGLLGARFGDHLFAAGPPLDARHHFIVIPDALGHGSSSKPSDGLRAAFPRYGYADMVDLQRRLTTQALGIDRFKVMVGLSMGGMHAWDWCVRFPGDMDRVVTLAALPKPMSGRNWMLRRLLVDSIRRDPDWANGNYVEPPQGLRRAWIGFNLASNGGALGLQRLALTPEAGDRELARRFAAPLDIDANDLIYQWEAARDYDPSG